MATHFIIIIKHGNKKINNNFILGIDIAFKEDYNLYCTV